MNYLLLCVLIIFVSLVTVFGQEIHKVYEIPSDRVAWIVANDPSCPIHLGNPKLLAYENGTFEKIYTLSNLSDKSIVRFTIEELSLLNGTAYSKDSLLVSGQEFIPGEIITTALTGVQYEYLSFNDLPEKLKKSIPTGWILIVTRVEMSDGAIYDASSKYKEIRNFVDGLNVDAADPQEDLTLKVRRLKNFIAKSTGSRE